MPVRTHQQRFPDQQHLLEPGRPIGQAGEMAMVTRQPFGQLLKRYRLAAGLTHEALAERAMLSARAISDLERGVNRRPREATLALLMDALCLAPTQRALLEAAARSGDATLSLAAAHGTLPTPLTSLVGREREEQLARRLFERRDTRLVTLTGPGGVGKTRFGIHLAWELAARFADGVWYVPLAPVADRAGIVRAIARALGLPDYAGLHQSSIITALCDRNLLLVLDNYEHLLDSASLVTDLMRGCPQLSVLVTSRAPLRVSSELEMAIPPLVVPNLQQPAVLATLATNPAVALFVDRAARFKPDFVLQANNAAAVAAICVRLDGLPLALELAAARIKILPPERLLDRLEHTSGDQFLGLLSNGPRDVPSRLQTLRDTISWSYHLLTADEQHLFRLLSVFAAGCTIEAAEAILAPQAEPAARQGVDVLTGIASLVDNSLLYQQLDPQGSPRFMMLETIRAFAVQQLTAAGEEDEARARHARYYLALLEATGALLFASEAARRHLAYEQDNIQQALRWLVQQG
jgi:predicted ATPase/DNA-binding XRE family transcriptional regulator